MTRTLCALGLASVLLTGVAPCGFAASGDGGDNASQSVTGAQLGSQQVGRPATGTGATAGTYGMSTPGYPPPTGAQSSPDANHPTVASPSGGGNGNGGGAGSGGAGGGSR